MRFKPGTAGLEAPTQPVCFTLNILMVTVVIVGTLQHLKFDQKIIEN